MADLTEALHNTYVKGKNRPDWASESIATKLCAKQGHKFVVFVDFSDIPICELCGIDIEDVNEGEIRVYDNDKDDKG